MNNEKYSAYVKILNDELQVALGCTEPIALSYCACVVKEKLGGLPDKCTVTVCGNIIKNAKSVVVPNTNGKKGIEYAVAAGFFASSSNDKLTLLSSIDESKIALICDYIKQNRITVEKSDCGKTLYISIFACKGNKTCKANIENSHTNLTLIEIDGKTVYKQDQEKVEEKISKEYSLLSVADIYDFASNVNIKEIEAAVGRQIEYNSAVSVEGLTNNYGAQVGKVLLSNGNDISTRAQAVAAAGSDARMSGCCLPVVIISGSGNQGITACMPVVEYGKHLGSTKEDVLRAVTLADLITIHQKTGIGKLSAFCGAISAGVGAACGVAFLQGGDLEVISHTLVNALAITSGIVCDGAKPSCAGKIATAIYGGLLGYNLYKHGQEFLGGDGIITKGADKTIANVSRLASKGMSQTDKEILDIMCGIKDEE